MTLRLFVCEFVTGGGLCGQPLPPGLAREGEAMLRALVKDLLDLPGLELVSTRDARLPESDLPMHFEAVVRADAVWPLWRRLIEESDAFWPIAPESGGVLERLSRMATDQGRVLFGSAPAAVRVAASKRATAQHLIARGLPAVPCLDAVDLERRADGWVVKPDDGAGCLDTRFVGNAAAIPAVLADRDCVVQPCLDGPSASLSLLCQDGDAWLLSYNRQDVELSNGVFRYRGCMVGTAPESGADYAALARQVVAALPGLWGYVGVDMLETRDGPVIVEINPRLTTSYIGLRESLGRNPAAFVLALRTQALAAVRCRLAPRPVAVAVEGVHA